MKTFVTGGAGYIGSVTVERLIEAGHEVIVFDNLERGHRAAVDPRARLITGDLREFSSIENALKQTRPEAVIHFAAYALVGESMTNPDKYFANNVKGGINLTEAMLKTGVRKIVFSSSCATYGQPNKMPITENTPQKPTNPYGESKLMFEKILDWMGQTFGLQSVFLRYFNACGASAKFGEDHDPETHLIPNIIRVALGQKNEFEVFGNDYATPDGTCIRDYIHIEDLAQAHMLALTGNHIGAFNLGTGGGYSVLEIISAFRKVTGINVPVKMMPRRRGDPDRLVADTSKAIKSLGWRPTLGAIENIISTAWSWHKEHPQGYGK